MAVRVSTGQQCRVAGSGARVRIVVVAIREIGTMVKKEPESAFPEQVTVALQVITAKLIDYYDDDQFGAGIISGCKTQAGEPDKKKAEDRALTRDFHRARSLPPGCDSPKDHIERLGCYVVRLSDAG